MMSVTIPSRYQVVIPSGIRERLGLTPGQQGQAIACDNRIEPIPVRPIVELRGFVAGISTQVPCEGDRVRT